MKLAYDEIDSPVGTMLLATGDAGVCILEFDTDPEATHEQLARRFGDVALRRRKNPEGYSDRLKRYFDGDVDTLDDIPVDLGGTPFQKRVWKELRRIRAGRTRSYADLARRIGKPTATRAVGAANGRNPVAVIVPCHRVIGADGTLTGYGGGLDRKHWLLAHEGADKVAARNARYARSG